MRKSEAIKFLNTLYRICYNKGFPNKHLESITCAIRSLSRKSKVCVCKGYVTELYKGFSLENLIIVKSKFCGWCGGKLKESK